MINISDLVLDSILRAVKVKKKSGVAPVLN
jgi:hypothetical protein